MKTSYSLVAIALLIAPLTSTARADDPAPAGPAATPPKAAPVVSVPTYENATCPIMGRPSSKVLFTDTDFGRIYVCCPPCIKKIQLDAERAAKAAYPVVKKAGNQVDPVTGAKIGATPVLVTLQGYEIALASEESVKPARANAQIVITKALDAAVVDVGNQTDPITGKPVVANAFVLIDKNLVHLSAPSVVEEVKKDPAAALAAAKAIAAREKAAGASQPK